MIYPIPHHLNAEQHALIARIHAAFHKVQLGDGISWSQCQSLDLYESEEEQARARAQDETRDWSKLIDNPQWEPFPGVGGFAFINELGFRYYLPPTMIRFAKGDITQWYEGHFLQSIDGLVNPRSSVWTPDQISSIAHFIAFMAKAGQEWSKQFDHYRHFEWDAALTAGWSEYLPPT